ncbi:hypothetical protein TNCT_192371 [Trichonephila clavata]|uniref:Uncharacterized protein n=1 Tax=Trichonephila clavata TaxID=2740835 RepID=A0A8X6KYH1_TRICU|nr:hypothetical protein TNCT_192371 [Trichonephila clavata]
MVHLGSDHRDGRDRSSLIVHRSDRSWIADRDHHEGTDGIRSFRSDIGSFESDHGSFVDRIRSVWNRDRIGTGSFAPHRALHAGRVAVI